MQFLRPTLLSLPLLTGLLGGTSALAQAPAEQVLITATRRPQDLRVVDGGVSVLTGQQLIERGVDSVADLEKLLPGLVVRTRGNRAYANITIRGMSSPDFYNPSVQIYVDGVPQEASFFAQQLVDVDRVEFLRGPQGTLYGRNAFGGVLNIVTRQSRESLIRANLDGAFDRYRGEAAATAVLGAGVFADFAVQGEHYNGRVDDASTGRKDINDTESFSGRAALRYAPEGSAWDATLSFSGEKLASHEEMYLFDAEIQTRRFFSATQGPVPFLKRYAGTGALRWNYRFGAATLSGTTSYQSVHMQRNISGLNFPENDRTYTQELQLASTDGGPLSYVLGFFYDKRRFERDGQGFPGFFGDSQNLINAESVAGFGELTYALTDRLSLTGGLRVSSDHSTIDYARQPPSAFAFANSKTFTSVQPKVSVGYALNDTSRIYALVSRGYKPGGFNHAVSFPTDSVPYKPETAWNYEAGVRSAFMDGRVDFSLSAYYITSEDKQIYVGPVGVQVIRNVGDAVSKGIEAEARFRAMENLDLGATFTLGESRFDTFVDPTTLVSYNNNHVPFAPDMTANVNGRLVVLRDLFGGELVLLAGVNYTSRVYFDEANTMSQKPVATVDLAVELALPDDLTLRIYSENVFDKMYRQASFNFRRFGPNDIRSNFNEGRFIGVSLRKTVR